MLLFSLKDTISYKNLCSLLILCLLFTSCNITYNFTNRVKKAPEGKPYLIKNSFEVKGGNFSKVDRSALESRLSNQLDDSSILVTSDVIFLFHVLKSPPAYDTAYSVISANNMRKSMYHIGYYNSTATYLADTTIRKRKRDKANYKADTSIGKKRRIKVREVSVHYTVEVGRATLVDTLMYRLSDTALQKLALKYSDKSVLKINDPVTKAGVLGEISRQVDTFRNNGYYKFTTSELRMRGDSTIEALTTVSDDPFEQLQLLSEAQQKIDSPSIKLAMLLNRPEDSTKLNQYRVRKIYVLQDYRPGDDLMDTTRITQTSTRNFIMRYHQRLFRFGFLARNITLRPGSLFSLGEYNKTLINFSKYNVWQTVNIVVTDVPDSNKVDLVIELVPNKKFGFEAGLEVSYAASNNSSNALSGNLLGIFGNVSITNRNIAKEAIRMTHILSAGIELNGNSGSTNTSLINSNEISYSNNIIIPKNIPFWPTKRRTKPGESFINSRIAYSNRLNLYDLQSFGLNLGKNVPGKNNTATKRTNYVFKPLFAEFSYLYNETDSFETILVQNPFLRYSYNTSFVMGMGGGVSNVYRNPAHTNRERSLKFNAEESGLTWGTLPILNKYKKTYIKLDGEYKYTVNYQKTSFVMRGFVGVGIPIFKDSSLPFFKQFFGGGSYSMRGWPLRGIGVGGQSLPPYQANFFNDRTADIQIEMNAEYRYVIAHIIPNLLTLRGAVFADIGNIWSFKNLSPAGQPDSAQFKFDKLYEQIGLSLGTGFRLDFNYVVLRFDMGFRFKRPETSYVNDGWKAPDIGIGEIFKKLFTRGPNDVYRIWRYENYNFTIGISYPF